jgi:DNA-binding MarR family transcriptional regulator
MPSEELVDDVAAAVLEHVNRLDRRLRQRPVTGELSQAESATLSHLSSAAPTTVADLARSERMRPQSMGAIVGGLESRGLVKRHRDRGDSRRVMLTVTDAGRQQIERRRTARGDQLAQALSEGFTDDELRQLQDVAPLLGRIAERLDP